MQPPALRMPIQILQQPTRPGLITSLSNSKSDAKASANRRLGQWRELSKLSWTTALVESGGEEGNVRLLYLLRLQHLDPLRGGGNCG